MDAHLPALFEFGEQARGTAHGVWVARHTLRAAVLPLGDQTGSFQHRDVFLHGGKRHVVAGGEFAYRRIGIQDARKDVATRRIGECPEHLVQRLCGCRTTYNHLVVDNSTTQTS